MCDNYRTQEGQHAVEEVNTMSSRGGQHAVVSLRELVVWAPSGSTFGSNVCVGLPRVTSLAGSLLLGESTTST